MSARAGARAAALRVHGLARGGAMLVPAKRCKHRRRAIRTPACAPVPCRRAGLPVTLPTDAVRPHSRAVRPRALARPLAAVTAAVSGRTARECSQGLGGGSGGPALLKKQDMAGPALLDDGGCGARRGRRPLRCDCDGHGGCGCGKRRARLLHRKHIMKISLWAFGAGRCMSAASSLPCATETAVPAPLVLIWKRRIHPRIPKFMR